VVLLLWGWAWGQQFIIENNPIFPKLSGDFLALDSLDEAKEEIILKLI
jgi:hypothetical protein